MVKCDEKYLGFKYYNENNEHEFIDSLTKDKAVTIINDLMFCPEFKCDSTILGALYMAMRKLQGLSDEDIMRLMR